MLVYMSACVKARVCLRVRYFECIFLIYEGECICEDQCIYEEYALIEENIYISM